MHHTIAFLTGSAVFLFLLAWRAKSTPLYQRGLVPTLHQGAQMFVPLVQHAYPDDVKSETEKRLAWAGLENITATEFLAIRISCALSVPVIGGLLAAVFGVDIIWALLLAGVGYMAPEFWLQARVNSRQKLIRKSVMEFATLLATVLDAGGGDIYMALDHVGARFKDELGKEVRRTAHDIATGKRRNDALKDMASRCGVEELDQLVRVILQAERYGTPIAEAVRQHAGQVRLMRRYAAEKVANEASVKMVFPMLIFIIGPLLIMLIYPAAQQFSGILS